MLEKRLADFIKGLRANKRDEEKYIKESLVLIHKELTLNDHTSKAIAISKLTYLHMLGYDMSWASFNVVEVMAASKYEEKRMGYLAAVQSFYEETDVLVLTTNLFRKDLASNDSMDVSLALEGLSEVVNLELSVDLLESVIAVCYHRLGFIRKKAILVLYKFILKNKETLNEILPVLKEKLEDPDSSVVSATASVICELAQNDPKSYLPLAPKLYKLLNESGVSWMIIKIVKLFASLTPLEPRLAKKLYFPIMNLILTTNKISLLYECINTCVFGGIITLQIESKNDFGATFTIAELCSDKLGEFIESSDVNKNSATIIYNHNNSKDTLNDFDSSKLHSDFDISNDDNGDKRPNPVVGISDSHEYRTSVVNAVISMCTQNNYSNIRYFEWYIETLVKLSVLSKTKNVDLQIAKSFIDVTARVRAVRRFSVLRMTALIDEFVVGKTYEDSKIHDNLLKNNNPLISTIGAAAYIVGEYGKTVLQTHQLVSFVDNILELIEKTYMKSETVYGQMWMALTKTIVYLLEKFCETVTDNSYGKTAEEISKDFDLVLTRVFSKLEEMGYKDKLTESFTLQHFWCRELGTFIWTLTTIKTAFSQFVTEKNGKDILSKQPDTKIDSENVDMENGKNTYMVKNDDNVKKASVAEVEKNIPGYRPPTFSLNTDSIYTNTQPIQEGKDSVYSPWIEQTPFDKQVISQNSNSTADHSVQSLEVISSALNRMFTSYELNPMAPKAQSRVETEDKTLEFNSFDNTNSFVPNTLPSLIVSFGYKKNNTSKDPSSRSGRKKSNNRTTHKDYNGYDSDEVNNNQDRYSRSTNYIDSGPYKSEINTRFYLGKNKKQKNPGKIGYQKYKANEYIDDDVDEIPIVDLELEIKNDNKLTPNLSKSTINDKTNAKNDTNKLDFNKDYNQSFEVARDDEYDIKDVHANPNTSTDTKKMVPSEEFNKFDSEKSIIIASKLKGYISDRIVKDKTLSLKLAYQKISFMPDDHITQKPTTGNDSEGKREKQMRLAFGVKARSKAVYDSNIDPEMKKKIESKYGKLEFVSISAYSDPGKKNILFKHQFMCKNKELDDVTADTKTSSIGDLSSLFIDELELVVNINAKEFPLRNPILYLTVYLQKLLNKKKEVARMEGIIPIRYENLFFKKTIPIDKNTNHYSIADLQHNKKINLFYKPKSPNTMKYCIDEIKLLVSTVSGLFIYPNHQEEAMASTPGTNSTKNDDNQNKDEILVEGFFICGTLHNEFVDNFDQNKSVHPNVELCGSVKIFSKNGGGKGMLQAESDIMYSGTTDIGEIREQRTFRVFVDLGSNNEIWLESIINALSSTFS
ncbi:hypothetical protein BB559_000918 [Furculomyces boomerangus]|uniref:Clathrin/coatomer adaptor adaptin-like N-terminal domain-containing protein n=1 Tax=Furculomyces boomerangus TaxID=61424 RepID=A0A2T9Z3M9_9FUNG|nr:hypothetical protein BB559_000918 [Furculomyces boomerangus]